MWNWRKIISVIPDILSLKRKKSFIIFIEFLKEQSFWFHWFFSTCFFFTIFYSIDFILTFIISFILIILEFNLLFLSYLHYLEFDVNGLKPLFFFNIGARSSLCKYCFISILESVIDSISIFFVSKHFLISILFSSLIYMLFGSVLIICQIFAVFSIVFCYLFLM